MPKMPKMQSEYHGQLVKTITARAQLWVNSACLSRAQTVTKIRSPQNEDVNAK
jgi:hypothetical protein